MDRNPGSDLPENLGLLEYGCIETSRPKCERSSQTSDSTADDCNAKRTGHFTQTFAVNRKHGSCEATGQLRLSADSWLIRRKGACQVSDHRFEYPAPNRVHRRNDPMAGPADSCGLLPGRIGQCTRLFKRKH